MKRRKQRSAPAHGARRPSGGPSLLRPGYAVAAIAILVIGVGVAVLRPQGGARPEAGAPQARAVIAGAPLLGRSGVRVDAAEVDLGRIPLDTTVAHAFRVSNESAAPVTLGRATIAVLEGC